MEKALGEPPFDELVLDARGRSDEEVIREAVLTVCDVEGDDARMRKILLQGEDRRAKFFDRLRKTYPVRREFHNTRITLKHPRAALKKALKALEFKVG